MRVLSKGRNVGCWKLRFGRDAVTYNENILGQTMGVGAYRGFRKRSLEVMRSRDGGQSVEWIIYVDAGGTTCNHRSKGSDTPASGVL